MEEVLRTEVEIRALEMTGDTKGGVPTKNAPTPSQYKLEVEVVVHTLR
ncbi:hypothetical protein A2U01_0068995, partial [Trifolium medium]|nr:hypothetical protein [Trifolium medium]